jgi:hypothetical protein
VNLHFVVTQWNQGEPTRGEETDKDDWIPVYTGMTNAKQMGFME